MKLLFLSNACPEASRAGFAKLLRIMKLATFIMLTACLYAKADGYSQKITLSLERASVKSIFKQISEQSGYHFLYTNKVVSRARPVTIAVKNASIKEVLDKCLADQGLTYTIYEKTIIIKLKKEAPVIAEIKAEDKLPPPPILIKGSVKNDKGEPLAGVSIKIKNAQTGTFTNQDGNFEINVPDEKAELEFSYIGFTTQSIVLNKTTELHITLIPENKEMTDIVVIGYGSVKRSDLTGAVSSLKSKDITAIPVSNALEALQGKIAGMDITKSDGGTGSGIKVNLRGNRSLTASNDPLILVDGIPYGSTLDLNTSDIESMEVLKDASSTAIYGSRGANGVILITTKKGKTGKPTISLSSYYGVQSPVGLPVIQTGDQFAAFKREAFKTAGITDDNLIFNPGELTAIRDKIYTDWMREILIDGSIQNHELSVNGGNEKATYNMSFGGFNEKGLFKNDNLRRYNGALGASIKLAENLKVGTNIIYTYKNNNRRLDPLNQANKIYPFGTPYDSAGNIALYPVLGQSFSISPLADEVPGAFVDNRIGKRLFSSSHLDWEIIKDLLFKTSFGLDIQNDRRGYYRGKYTISQNGGLSTSGIESNNATNYTWENTLNYKKLAGQHDFNFLAGNSVIKNSLESFSGAGFNQVSDINTYYNLGSNASLISVGSSLVESKLTSYFGRLNYKFSDKYLVTASIRADGASVLAAGNKWAYFPSIAAGWKISEENFFRNITAISTLKIRGSWGISGNSSVLPYQTLGSLGRSVYAFDETAAYGYYPKDISNPDLKWEKTATTNIGMDFGLFKNRISGSIEVYQSKTSDLLLQRILPSSSGFSSILENIGKTKNNGLEIAISTTNFSSTRANGFKWFTDFTYTRNKEEIVELAGGVSRDLANSWFVGQPTQVYYNYQKTGIWQLGKEAEAAKYGQKPGDIQVLDVDGDGKITSAGDRVIVGTSRPKYSFGINNNLQYMNFDLTAFVYGRIGQTILNEASGNYKISGLENGVLVDYWTPSNPTNSHPRPDKDKTGNSAFMSTLYYADGGFVKIRDITLGYSFPSAAIQRYSLSRLRFYATAKNFFTFSHIDSYDPERGGSVSFPMTKQLVFGLNVSFK